VYDLIDNGSLCPEIKYLACPPTAASRILSPWPSRLAP